MPKPHKTRAGARKSVDRSAGAARTGSVILVLLVAALLVGAAAAFVVLGQRSAEPYILVFLAVLATVGVFSLFALASGILRLPAAGPANPLIKTVVDEAFDGILVTDADGRVIYANAAYLDLIDADASEMRPVERVFIGDADASEAIYRLLKAAREGKRLQEEVRVAGLKGRPARWLRLRVRPLGERGRDRRLTVWSLSDVTRERERQENVFQELQHAIDYLDHAPAGFFSVDAKGDVVYLNATLATWLDQDLAQVGSGGLKLSDLVAGDGAALLDDAAGGAGRAEDRSSRSRPQDAQRAQAAGAPFSQGCLRRRWHARRVAHARAQSRAGRRHRSAARGRNPLHALLPQHADGDRDRRSRAGASCAPIRCSRGCSTMR